MPVFFGARYSLVNSWLHLVGFVECSFDMKFDARTIEASCDDE